MTDVLTPDLCVIGGGAAGLAAAAVGAAFGISVVLVEERRLGGECLHTGCVPSKALIAAARSAHAVQTASRFGIRAEPPDIDFSAVMEHVRAVVSVVGRSDTAERFGGLGVKVISGRARFTGPRVVAAAGKEIRARRTVIATGSRPFVPPIPNLETVPFLTNETVFGLARRPGHLIVIGGGATGLELGQAFWRLGSRVTVLDAGDALAGADPELTALLVESLREEGVVIRDNVRIARAARRGRAGVRITLEGAGEPVPIDGTHLLIATGRRANLDDLGLAEARIVAEEDGIAVDDRLRTSNRRVYAIGDVVKGSRSTHSAADQAARVMRSTLFRFGGRRRAEHIPFALFTDPELAQIGLSESDARRRFRGVQVLRWPLSENDRARTDRCTRGMVKVVATRRGAILGVSILGQQAGELIAPWSLALSQHLSVRDVLSAVLPYPTLSEAGKRAAMEFYVPKLASPLMKRVIGLLRAFG
jgi:pyruvate/2-oxoglutarate dehydrogenase complex dihydrolipoamide dehydrogenase (E3) component